jgi:hypothetical protein
MSNKRSEYNRNYYQKHREEIIKKHLEYYKENREIIRNRYKEYNIYYYQKNKEKIITRVQNNYYLKVGYPKERLPQHSQAQAQASEPEKIIIKNEILENNIIIRLMD